MGKKIKKENKRKVIIKKNKKLKKPSIKPKTKLKAKSKFKSLKVKVLKIEIEKDEKDINKTSSLEDPKIELEKPIPPEELESVVEEEEEEEIKSSLEDILFKLPLVDSPIVGTPKQAQQVLDQIALKIQKRPNSKKGQLLFNKIHLYMHGYLINVVLKQFPYIKGYQTVDIYQEALIALRFRAIPNFASNKGMSFLNFAKMCIRRYLITILNTSKTCQKDQAINQAVSLNSSTSNDEESNNSLSNIIPDKGLGADEKTDQEEAYKITKETLMKMLSDFEKIVLEEYLATSTYKEIADSITKKTKVHCEAKAVDNALGRIRKKAAYLKKYAKIEEIPLFIL
jgi:DNA-directed RNA polymerase specialized sigma24 family protein